GAGVRQRDAADPGAGRAEPALVPDRGLRAAGRRPPRVAVAPRAAGARADPRARRPRRAADTLGAHRGPALALRAHRPAQGRDGASDRAASRPAQRPAAGGDGDRPRSRLSHGRHRRRRGGLRVSGHGTPHPLRDPEPRRSAAAGVDPHRGRHLHGGQLRGRHALRVARSADSLPVKRNPALALGLLLVGAVIVPALGATTGHARLAMGVANAPGIARIVRSQTLAVKHEEFVLAARAQGDSHGYVMLGEILPNLLPPIVIEATIRVGFAILAGASLSFLGLGVQPPQADWGLMIREARQYIFLSSWPLLCPGAALAITIVGSNLFGDGLRDWLAP